MNVENKHFYRFNSFQLDVAERQLLNDGVQVPLTPRAFDVLVALVERSGHLVEKHELLRLVWSDSFVEEGNLTRIIHTLRKTLGEDKSGNKFIETVAKKGYRFVAKTTEARGNQTNVPPVDLLVKTDAPKLEQKDADVLESISEFGNRQSDSRKKLDRRLELRTLLALIIGLILVFSVMSFLSAKKSWTTKSGAENTPRHTSNGEAYQHYQQGKLFLDRKLKGDYKLALASFEKAIELDPSYAAAYVGKADAKIWMFWASDSHSDITQARTAVNKSLELDETNAYAHVLLCRIKVTYEWDFDGGEKECRRAIELDPNSPEAHTEFAHFLKVLGRDDEALAEIDTAIVLAPTSFNKRSRGQILYYSRRYDEAIAQLEQVAETDPKFSMAHRWIMRSYEMKNDHARAFEWHLRQLEQDSATPERVAALKSLYNKDGWRGVLRNMIDSRKPESTGNGFGYTETAIMYCRLGENDRAFEYFNKAYEYRELYLTHIRREPRLDSIRTDPRYEELVKRIGLK